MSYKEQLQTNNNEINANNVDIQTAIDMVNALPDAVSSPEILSVELVVGYGSIKSWYGVTVQDGVLTPTSGTIGPGTPMSYYGVKLAVGTVLTVVGQLKASSTEDVTSPTNLTFLEKKSVSAYNSSGTAQVVEIYFYKVEATS